MATLKITDDQLCMLEKITKVWGEKLKEEGSKVFIDYDRSYHDFMDKWVRMTDDDMEMLYQLFSKAAIHVRRAYGKKTAL